MVRWRFWAAARLHRLGIFGLILGAGMQAMGQLERPPSLLRRVHW
jgi:hypothetical protein